MGVCGEKCPAACSVCMYPRGWKDVMTLDTIDELEPGTRLLELPCRHIVTVDYMDALVDQVDPAAAGAAAHHGAHAVTGGGGAAGGAAAGDAAAAAAGPTLRAVKLPLCPECRTPIYGVHRYGEAMGRCTQELNSVKLLQQPAVLADKVRELVNSGRVDAALEACSRVFRGLEHVPGSLPRKAYIAAKLLWARTHLTHKPDADPAPALAALEALAATADAEAAAGDIPASDASSIRAELLCSKARIEMKAGHAERAGELLAEALRISGRAGGGGGGAVVGGGGAAGGAGGGIPAAVSPDDIEKALADLAAQAITAQFGYPGHWYVCPRGHPYVIGECGGAMEASRCPDCGEAVGGANHALTAGNRHTGRYDGSAHAAWSDEANMAAIAAARL